MVLEVRSGALRIADNVDVEDNPEFGAGETHENIDQNLAPLFTRCVHHKTRLAVATIWYSQQTAHVQRAIEADTPIKSHSNPCI